MSTVKISLSGGQVWKADDCRRRILRPWRDGWWMVVTVWKDGVTMQHPIEEGDLREWIIQSPAELE